ncbi:hypothetical protein ASG43_08840 [Aureimonas sp. Leaf454]|uniref:hypothetical protein n=1 Tax=Aureimonas sp. Leaf454 TaxID=1736381 RepID=UPI0006FD69C3|nr:hypothetical protein [Aureimonas sp. Leaf454]KQT48931.1 hypothetical protein ASG43_08840 [Aureimonas sp. Leaf454]
MEHTIVSEVEVDQFAAAKMGDFRHPASILARLGIEYEYEVETADGALAIFHRCINVPAALPAYVTARA